MTKPSRMIALSDEPSRVEHALTPQKKRIVIDAIVAKRLLGGFGMALFLNAAAFFGSAAWWLGARLPIWSPSTATDTTFTQTFLGVLSVTGGLVSAALLLVSISMFWASVTWAFGSHSAE